MSQSYCVLVSESVFCVVGHSHVAPNSDLECCLVTADIAVVSERNYYYFIKLNLFYSQNIILRPLRLNFDWEIGVFLSTLYNMNADAQRATETDESF